MPGKQFLYNSGTLTGYLWLLEDGTDYYVQRFTTAGAFAICPAFFDTTGFWFYGGNWPYDWGYPKEYWEAKPWP